MFSYVISQNRTQYWSENQTINWYTKSFNVSDPVKITRIIEKYLTSLQFVFLYYIKGIQNWAFFYPFHMAPLIISLDLISNFTIHDFSFMIDDIENKPLLPFQ